mmetsp:Transcript_435/g.675  ORF Transcript_435/g.675 Transcript_435/m.675 type:complete len:257 (+) Transcript_435:1582-2352(+)
MIAQRIVIKYTQKYQGGWMSDLEGKSSIRPRHPPWIETVVVDSRSHHIVFADNSGKGISEIIETNIHIDQVIASNNLDINNPHLTITRFRPLGGWFESFLLQLILSQPCRLLDTPRISFWLSLVLELTVFTSFASKQASTWSSNSFKINVSSSSLLLALVRLAMLVVVLKELVIVRNRLAKSKRQSAQIFFFLIFLFLSPRFESNGKLLSITRLAQDLLEGYRDDSNTLVSMIDFDDHGTLFFVVVVVFWNPQQTE